MRYFGSHFVYAYILNCSTLTKFQLSVWSSTMPKETESIKKKLNTLKQGKAPNLGLAAGLNGLTVHISPQMKKKNVTAKKNKEAPAVHAAKDKRPQRVAAAGCQMSPAAPST